MKRREFLKLLGLAPFAPLAAKAKEPRYVTPAYFGGMPRYNIGGIVGEEVPIIARMGEGTLKIASEIRAHRGLAGRADAMLLLK